jgi:hypothetical protein
MRKFTLERMSCSRDVWGKVSSGSSKTLRSRFRAQLFSMYVRAFLRRLDGAMVPGDSASVRRREIGYSWVVDVQSWNET